MLKAFSRTANYEPVQEVDEAKVLMSETSSIEIEPNCSRSRSRWSLFVSFTVLLLYSLCVLLLGSFIGTNHPTNLDSKCTKHTSKYCELNLPTIQSARLIHLAPVMEAVDVTYKKHLFDGSFSHPNIYRQDASPEVDAAWTALGADCMDTLPSHYSDSNSLNPDTTLQIPTELAEKSGFTRDNNVMINEKYGGGYFAILEGVHHIHCLVGTSPTQSPPTLTHLEPRSQIPVLQL